MEEEHTVRKRFGQPKNRINTTQSSTPTAFKVSDDLTKGKKQRCSIGKTSNGQIFRVPATNDMVTTLLNPLEPKSVFDLITLGCMMVPFAIWLCLPSSISRYLLLGGYIFWRLSYNVGLGVLLKYQSDTNGLVDWCRRHRLFDMNPGASTTTKKKTADSGTVGDDEIDSDDEEVVRRHRGSWAYWLKRQLSIKMESDYQFEKVPVEYNTWLLFRQLVDLILMNDFTYYFFFVLAWFNSSFSSTSFYFMLGGLLRWSFGLFLILFNIWVKLDAHRVVKDFAWYWGDFFFLVEQSLTFDGVFEMAPHPMYSIGYFGYYGLSLISASYCVLFVSIAAHALQFAFLVLVETPHIEKIYNPRKVMKRQPRVNMTVDDDVKNMMMALDRNAGRDIYSSWSRSDMVILKNLDLFRSTDIVSMVVMVYSLALPLLLPGETGMTVAIWQAFIWRIIYSGGLGTLLSAQSKNKFFTRHFVKWGGNQMDAFQNWKSIFNLSLSMTYITFFMACWKAYALPEDWTYGTTLLRHTLGLAFISLHIWTSVSIFEVLGDFGWFYGDFFIDEHQNTLMYTGIYRFLNNPEKIMGHAAFWGMTLIANNWIIYGLALFSQLSNVLFLQYVEAPHMQKLYGDQIRLEAGLTKTLRSAANAIPKTLPEKLQGLVKMAPANDGDQEQDDHTTTNTTDLFGKVEKAIGETVSSVNDAIAVGPELRQLIMETKNELDSSSSEQPRSSSPLPSSHGKPDGEQHIAQQYKIHMQQQQWTLGTPIKIDWEIVGPSKKAQDDHQSDWIGIYKVKPASPPSPLSSSPIPSSPVSALKQVTTVGSNGRWMWLNSDENKRNSSTDDASDMQTEGLDDNKGTVTFKGLQLPWEIGHYECKLHYGTSHLVLAVSEPFEVILPTIPDIDDTDGLSLCLLKSVQHVMGNDVGRMPMSMVDSFVLIDEEAKRIAYVIMILFDLEFAWQVISADNSIVKLVKRVQLAQNILSPFENRNLSSPMTAASSP